MPQFRYRAVTHAGEIVVGEVDASSREEVVRRIEYLGHLTIDAEIAATGILDRGRRSIGKLPRSRDVSIFLRQLALLIGAGLMLDAALQTLGDDASKGLAGFAGRLRESISAGESFADALEHHSSIIDPTYVAMVRVGEASGKLEAVLRAIVEDRTRCELMADRINSAIRYPLFLIGTAAVILLFFLIYGIDALWSGRQAVVRFHPDGASTGAVLKLSREKAEYEIRVNRYTGGVAIAP